jgi:molybdenum cofactor biosynthesis protein MoaC
MRDITHKQITLRKAKAIGIVFCKAETLQNIESQQIEKGNVFEFARAAAFLGAKNTANLLPHCHPVTIDGLDISFEFINKEKHQDLFDESVLSRTGIVITGEGKSIGRTGIEMEVLTAVSVAALEIYDMLKPIDKNLEISGIRLLEKKGGKSDKKMPDNIICAVLVSSDSAANGGREDVSGKLMKELLEKEGAFVKDYQILPDDKEKLKQQILDWVAEDIPFIFTTGGTGLGPRDVTVEAVSEIIEKEAIGIAEAIRSYGQMRTMTAMMSRAIVGSVKQTLIITLPGSPKGVQESLEAILPTVFHARLMLEGQGH